MAPPLPGAGFLTVENLLEDCSYSLIQPWVNTTVPAGGIAAGAQTVDVFDPSMYVGAQLVVGAYGSADNEVVTITAVVPDVSFAAVFANAHVAGEQIVGATFPVRQPTDPLFEQGEMLAYLSSAVNDFLTDVPLCYNVVEGVEIGPSEPTGVLPDDSMMPVRIAALTPDGPYPLRETSQANLDTYDYRWSVLSQNYDYPVAYYRDKIPMQNFGIWPLMGNTSEFEIVYAQRAAATLGLADGFLFPDIFCPIVKWRTLSFAYSKDGESRNPALAKYWQTRYTFGCKVAMMILEAVNDSNLEMQS